MEYKKVETEMHEFDPIVDYKPPPKPFVERDDNKEERNKAKERRISISLVILTFLASVCVLFGTLFPELSRGEIDMVPWRNVILTTGKIQPHLIKDRITLVNLGLWRYCYDDQLYDLIELINPYYRSSVRRRRDAEDFAEEDELLAIAEEDHSIEKRQAVREGDISIRCHPVPEPWKMPYHVKNKTEATKVCLIIGIVMCIVSFLISILVLITRLPLLKLLQLISCFLGVAALGVGLGICITMKGDAEWYFNEAMGRYAADYLKEDFGLDIEFMSINLKSASLVSMNVGVSAVFVGAATFLMLVNTFLAELTRNLS